MANTSSARKAHRASLKKRVFNVRRKKAVHDSLKAATRAIATGAAEAAAQTLPALYKAIDKAAQRGTIKKNTAARMKSRITKRVQALAK
jgi:small subunit ribosomal protein S20